VPVSSTPEEFSRLVASESKRWSDMATRVNYEKQ